MVYYFSSNDSRTTSVVGGTGCSAITTTGDVVVRHWAPDTNEDILILKGGSEGIPAISASGTVSLAESFAVGTKEEQLQKATSYDNESCVKISSHLDVADMETVPEGKPKGKNIFLAWKQAAKDKIVWYLPGDVVSSMQDTVIYPVYMQDCTIPVSTGIILDGNGGQTADGSIYHITKASNSDLCFYELPDTFSREEYSFSEYNTEADGSGISYPAGSSIEPDSSSIIRRLYAIWESVFDSPENPDESGSEDSPCQNTHSFTNKPSTSLASEATCSEAAKYFVQCDNCNEVSDTLTVSVGEALGHVYSDIFTIDRYPTSTETGIKSRHCSRCESVTDVTIIPATSEEENDPVSPSPAPEQQPDNIPFIPVVGNGDDESVSVTMQNPDGSTTTTTNNIETGEVTQTTTNKNGVSWTAVYDKSDSLTAVSMSIPAPVIQEAIDNQEHIRLPLEVVKGYSQNEAVRIGIDIPSNAGSAKIEIPVVDMTPSTVAGVIREDGTVEILKTSVATSESIMLTVESDVVVTVFENSVAFEDVLNDFWAVDAIDFVAARQLFNGISETQFAPNALSTRAQLMTVLARLSGVDTSVNPLQTGMDWAVASGISDGSNPDGSISRQQLVTMLWRFSGSPDAHADVSHPDSNLVSEYAEMAFAWAIETGIIAGDPEGYINPTANATRAQIATILFRYINTVLV